MLRMELLLTSVDGDNQYVYPEPLMCIFLLGVFLYLQVRSLPPCVAAVSVLICIDSSLSTLVCACVCMRTCACMYLCVMVMLPFVQMMFLNSGLARFDALFVIPVYQVFWMISGAPLRSSRGRALFLSPLVVSDV